MESSVAAETVSALYLALLGREADANGLRVHTEALVTGQRTVPQLVRDFMNSAEGSALRRRWKPNLTGFPRFADEDVFVDRALVDSLFTKTATYWRKTASRPDEIYWSVLTEKNWSRTLTEDDRRKFVATGKTYAERILAEWTQRTGRPADGIRCLDFGCGVGRLAINFAPHVDEVCCVDFSEGHLAELKANAGLFGCADKVSTWLLRTPQDLASVPEVDLVYSMVALQHNTPPVIAFMMQSLLEHVKPGGLAFLHVTLAKAGYEGFSVLRYLTDKRAGTTMEVHFLPRANINDLARRAGFEIVSSECVGGNYYAYSEEFVFRRVGDAR